MKLKEKKEIPIEVCYDLSVQNNHNFFANGICVHNTNGGVSFRFNNGGEYECQSRTNIITPSKDNAGFATYVYSHKEEFVNLFGEIEDQLFHTIEQNSQFYGAVLYGEWCGGNIQKGVGINGLPKMFVVFGIKLLSNDPEEPNSWVSDSFLKEVVVDNPAINLYNVFTFGEWKIDIDFNEPEQAQNKLIDYTIAVEEECPVAKYFGVEKGTGEGIVYSCNCNGNVLKFKCKGEKHSVSKVKVLVPVDVERVNSLDLLSQQICPENRLLQIYDIVFNTLNGGEPDIKQMGEFIKAVIADVCAEELDTIIGSGFDMKSINNPISKLAKSYLFKRL